MPYPIVRYVCQMPLLKNNRRFLSSVIIYSSISKPPIDPPRELQRGSNDLLKCTYSVINNWQLLGLTIDQNRKAAVVLRHTFTYKKKFIQRLIFVNKDDRQKKYKLIIWILICKITRGMQHSVTLCIHEINEYKQNRFDTFGSKFCKIFSHYKFLVHESQMSLGGPHFWVKFPTVQSLTWVKCPVGGWAVLQLTGT